MRPAASFIIKAMPLFDDSGRAGDHIRMGDVKGAIPEAIYETLRACVLYATAQGAK